MRDERLEWPEGTAPGTFDITVWPIEGYPEAQGHMLFVCPNGRRCCVLVGLVAVPPADGNRLHVWGWDGDLERPTLNPSINCVAPAGCGWHGFVRGGVFE